MIYLPPKVCDKKLKESFMYMSPYFYLYMIYLYEGVEQDIFADVGKYIPVGHLENTDTDNPDTDKMSIQEISSAKGIFSNLLPSFPSSIKLSVPLQENSACAFDDDDDDELKVIYVYMYV